MFDRFPPAIAEFVALLNRFGGGDQDAGALFFLQQAANCLGDFRVKMFCYGTDEEQNLYEQLIDVIEMKNNLRRALDVKT